LDETALKWWTKLECEPNSSTTKASSVPALAMNQKAFCHLNVVFVPRMRMSVIHTIISRPPRKIHPLSVWM
jgi:hypothetical protein